MLSRELKESLLEFRKLRDWEKFHRPKELAISIVIEASELLENFQWKTDDEVTEMLSTHQMDRVCEEIADIVIYLTYLAEDLGVDIEEIVRQKLRLNQKRYPAERVRGSARKYSEYQE